MRTTLDIDADVLAAAKELSRRQSTSAGKVLSQLARQALTATSLEPARKARGGAARGVAGFRPLAPRGQPVTNELIDSLRDAEGI
jgi:hypothetical protein